MDPRLHFGTVTDGTLEGRRKWTVFGHPLVSRMLTRTKEFSNHNYNWNMGHMFGRSITQMDAPDHTRYRVLFQKAFEPRMLSGWKHDLVPRICNALVDRFAGRGQADLVSEFALHFPFQFVMELLDLPVEARPVFHKLAFCQTAVRYDPVHAIEAGEKLIRYIKWMIATRRDNPVGEHDFVNVLANAEVGGEEIPPVVLESFFRQLMNAAGDTSYHGFSSMIGSLLRHPAQFEAIRADRSLIPHAIDEALRVEPPICYLERSVHEPMEIEGHLVDPEDHISVCIGDANHDETIFEDPDTFDIFKDRRKHVAFGAGPHICIGQHLARVEMEVALNAILDRLPNLRLNPDYPDPVVAGVSMRKPKEVQVLFDA
jgi:cytochrome P450